MMIPGTFLVIVPQIMCVVRLVERYITQRYSTDGHTRLCFFSLASNPCSLVQIEVY